VEALRAAITRRSGTPCAHGHDHADLALPFRQRGRRRPRRHARTSFAAEELTTSKRMKKEMSRTKKATMRIKRRGQEDSSRPLALRVAIPAPPLARLQSDLGEVDGAQRPEGPVDAGLLGGMVTPVVQVADTRRRIRPWRSAGVRGRAADCCPCESTGGMRLRYQLTDAERGRVALRSVPCM
jgi:hypothetical protein